MPPFRLPTPLSLPRTFTSTPLCRAEHTFQIIPKCPPSTCACSPMPTLDIDYTRPLANTIPPYAQHILISTSQRNWPSRIEDEGSNSPWGALAAYLKHELGRKGSAHNPKSPTLVTTSSFGPNTAHSKEMPAKARDKGAMILFPSFRHYRDLDLSPAGLPQILPAIRGQRNPLPFTPITTPTILICSHNTRDTRCGTLGPILQQEFAKQFSNLGIKANNSNFLADEPKSVNIGCISHVGGHAWAGNVIVYLPENTANALAGTGMFYGRVEPRHVQGIIRETVLGGKVIRELWRGGIGTDGKAIRI